MIDVNEVKQKIIKYLEENGFSLPVRIAKSIELEPVFTSAILSELINSQKIKSTNFRLGASFFYFLDGQESGFEEIGNEYLKGVEKEAFLLLKKEKVLKDNEQPPAIRVALRSLKDFAIPFKHEDEICWRYSLISKDDIEKQMGNKDSKQLNSNDELKNVEDKKEDVESNDNEPKNDKQNTDTFESPFQSDKKIKKDESENKINDKTVFLEDVKEFLRNKELRLYEIVEESRNEIVGKVKINSDFGEIVFLVVARNKKSLSDADVLLANSKAAEFRVPLFLISKGKPNKKAQGVIDEYSNLIKFEEIKSL